MYYWQPPCGEFFFQGQGAVNPMLHAWLQRLSVQAGISRPAVKFGLEASLQSSIASKSKLSSDVRHRIDQTQGTRPFPRESSPSMRTTKSSGRAEFTESRIFRPLETWEG